MKKIKNIYNSRSKNFWALEFSYGLHFVALSVSAIFIPIIMLNLGFTLQDVVLYYVIFHFLNVVFHHPAKKFLQSQGLKRSLITGTVFAAAFFTSYLFLDDQNWTVLLLMAFIAAIYDSFYYIAYFYGFMNSTEKLENNAENNTILNIIASLSLFIGPLIGASIILISENKNYLLAVTIGIFTLSLLPLLKYKRTKKTISKESLSIRKFFSDPRNKKNYTTLAFYKISEAAESVLWPIFIFMIFKNIESVAYLSIVVIITSLLFTYVSGNIEKKNREKVIIYGALGLIFIWAGRMFFEHEIYLYASSILTGIFALFVRMPLDGNIFRHGEETDILTTAVLRNMISMGIKFVFYALVFAMLYFTHLQDSFILIILSLLVIIATNILYLRNLSK